LASSAAIDKDRPTQYPTLPMVSAPHDRFGVGTTFLLILAAFVGNFLLSWPIVFSFDLWVFKDRSSLLNLDYLLDKNFKLGVDTTYSYGLLPVLIQHVLFSVFGRGYWPLIGCTIIYLILTALFWARLLQHLPNQKIGLAAVVALSPIIIIVNPNFPHCLLILSILFSLLFVLERRLDIALACSVVGAVSVPSLPLVMVALIVFLTVFSWWVGPDRTILNLAKQLWPGIVTYLVLISFITGFFGFRSVLATALPFQGASFYRTMNFGLFSSFLAPKGVGFRYYLGNPIGWWVASSLILVALAAIGTWAMVRRRTLDTYSIFILLCACIHVVLAFFAYGSKPQHVIYDPVLAAGVLVGVLRLPAGSLRKILIGVFVWLGVLGYSGQIRWTWTSWQTTKPTWYPPQLYAEPSWAAEWARIVKLSAEHKLLLLSYGTGARQYFPSVETPDVWFFLIGLLSDAERLRIISQIQSAEIVVEDLSGPLEAVYDYPDIQHQFDALCLTESTSHFQIWQRRAADSVRSDCKTNSLLKAASD